MLTDGATVGYVVRAPPQANTLFLETFPGAFLPADTPVIMRCSPVAAAKLPEADSGARYRSALGVRDGGDDAAAASLFREIAAAGGPLAPVARLRAAQAFAEAGLNASAAPLFAEAAADSQLSATLRRIALREGADSLAQTGRATDALELLDRLISDPMNWGIRAGRRELGSWHAAAPARRCGLDHRRAESS